MYPILFHINTIAIRSYSVMFAIGIFLGIVLACREAKRVGLDPPVVANVTIVAILVALIGARLYYVICNWESYAWQWAKIVN